MLSQWRYVVVGATAAAAVLTPSTDPFTQVRLHARCMHNSIKYHIIAAACGYGCIPLHGDRHCDSHAQQYESLFLQLRAGLTTCPTPQPAHPSPAYCCARLAPQTNPTVAQAGHARCCLVRGTSTRTMAGPQLAGRPTLTPAPPCHPTVHTHPLLMPRLMPP